MARSSPAPFAVVGLLAGGFAGMVYLDSSRGQDAPPPAVPKELPSYREVVKQVLPAVVSLEGKSNRRPLPVRRPTDDGTPDLGVGSGFVIDADGVVLTNCHVVDGADTVEITFPDGRKLTATDIRRDPKTDLAVVKFAADKPLPTLPLGDSDAMEVGDRVLAVGAPYGLTGSVTAGIVSAKSRQNLRLNQYEDFLQTDAAMNPGNSGGPLVNLAGEAVGITSAIKTRGGGSNGVGLAVSSNLARDVAKQLLTNGVVRRGHLGVSVREPDAALAARLGVQPGEGVLITAVTANGPAARAGLKAGDVITAVSGQPVKDVFSLSKLVARLPLDQPAEVQYVRDGQGFLQPVTVTAQPEVVVAQRVPEPAAAGLAVAGLTLADLTPPAAVQLGLSRDARGAVVLGVDRAAAAVGLARGAVIVKVDRTPVGTAAECQQALAAADRDKGALLQVLRPGGESDFVVLPLK